MATFQYRQVRIANVGWLGRIGLLAAAALGIALVLALVVLSIGLAIVLVPVVALALVIGRWRLGKLQREMAATQPAGPAAGPRMIETDYVVIDRDDNRR